LSTIDKDFRVKHGLAVTGGGTFGAPVTVATPVDPEHAATKDYVDGISLTPGPTGPAGRYTVSATPPSSPTDGDAWLDSESAGLYVYIDSFWVEVTGSAGPTGPAGLDSTVPGPTGPAGISGVLSSTAVSSDITLESGNKYFVNTATARTLTLPASPTLGDEIHIFDASGTAGVNNITILNNSLKINGVTDSALLDVNGVAVVFVYTGSTYGWRMG